MSDKKIIVSAKRLADIHNQLITTTQSGDNMIIVGNCIMALRQILDHPKEYEEAEQNEEEVKKSNGKSDD